jgi:Ribonuclease G/E
MNRSFCQVARSTGHERGDFLIFAWPLHGLYAWTKHIGISRRIESEEERKRLKEIAESVLTEYRVILRTASRDEANETSIWLSQTLWRRLSKGGETAALR